MRRMTDSASIIAHAPTLTEADRDWLHDLIVDWGAIADLGYMDLFLLLPISDGHFIYAAQRRPNTRISTRTDDYVGRLAPEQMRPLLMSVLGEGRTIRQTYEEHESEDKYCDVLAPVVHDGRAIAVVIRETDLTDRQKTGPVERDNISCAKVLFSMIGRGQYPYTEPVHTMRHNPHVVNGTLTLNNQGVVRTASPNAISCLKRLGYVHDITSRSFADVLNELVPRDENRPDHFDDIVSGRQPAEGTLLGNGAAIAVRDMPLVDENGQPAGAVILCRDVTELRRSDQELETKDATISEIHHRVKNNLQSVSSLLHLQAARSTNPEVKAALQQAQRRVQTIAAVHDGLSQSADEMVDVDHLLPNLLRMSVDVEKGADQDIQLIFHGKFGRMPSQDATPLSLVLSELVTNAVEHGFRGRKKGTISISAARWGNTINVFVEDDGCGFDTADGADGGNSANGTSSGNGHLPSGLGTQLVTTFVRSDFGGTVRWKPGEKGGTRVEISLTLRAATNSAQPTRTR